MSPSPGPEGRGRVLGRTLSELGFELLKEVVDDPGGLGAWAKTLLSNRATEKPSRFNRQRDLYPLPMPVWTAQRVRDALQTANPFQSMKVRSANALAKLKNDLGAEIWLALQIISLDFLANGCSATLAPVFRARPNSVQRDALHRLATRARSFCGADADGETPRGPVMPWAERCSSQRLSYSGDVVTMPSPLTADQVEPGLPPLGLGGSAELMGHLSGEVAW